MLEICWSVSLCIIVYRPTQCCGNISPLRGDQERVMGSSACSHSIFGPHKIYPGESPQLHVPNKYVCVGSVS